MNGDKQKIASLARDERCDSASTEPKKAFVKPALKQWGSVDQVTGITF